ncbi:MAG TPA: ATP-binding protein [Anaerohalosphaeraceae bacterium]|mgnify:CR=1 FL=1|nr:ATP-binding protein [Anaerohalosphaeraceae bacterium]HOM75458.1 ATP-binding protein [Anaerohalosphaeraceae bacterium]HPC63814.1 ATP-binding protein [Anaerohalosphaeraceae bacterium]HPO69511.1 ATP-binding protein [Anaerohalosphaeraceae bacterium]HRS70285.1 ATP-binding protein [Anaerohalosphaeraceae bacterium]
MKKDQFIWIAASAAGLAAGGAAILAAVLSGSVSVILLAIVWLSIALTGGMLLHHIHQLKALERVFRVGSQMKIPFEIVPGSVLGDIANAANCLLDETHQKIRQMQDENRDLMLQMQLLRRRKSGIEAVLNSIQDGVLVTDDKDRVLLANPAAQNLLGFEFNKDNACLIQDAVNWPELVQLIVKSRQSKIPHVRHELSRQKDGRPMTFDSVLSCVEDDVGNVLQIVTVLHDITREKEISQMKNDFVSHVSHELKTPLASINAYAEMLVDGEAQDAETMRQFCSVIQGQAQRLSRLIEDILNISRIESGLVKVSRQNHSMALVIQDAVDMIVSYAQEKNISVEAPAPILYDQVYIDRDMISQVIINLLSNAVKYTPSGGQIAIRSEINELDGTITVTVTDTGVGIPEKDLPYVFDKFYRVEANNKYAKGTGLGLNLVKQIVESVHGGSVFASSTPGKGSTFGFILPLAKAAAAQMVS